MDSSNLVSEIRKRQQQFYDDSDNFWWSETGQVLKWTMFAGVVLIFVLYFVIGYYHAKSRMRRGLQPLIYHRWILTTHERSRLDPTYRANRSENYFYRPEYDLHPYPPPVYDPNAPAPPTYQPPQNPAKLDPSQWRADPTRVGEPAPREEEVAAPSGSPTTSAVQTHDAALSSSNDNPYKTWQ